PLHGSPTATSTQNERRRARDEFQMAPKRADACVSLSQRRLGQGRPKPRPFSKGNGPVPVRLAQPNLLLRVTEGVIGSRRIFLCWPSLQLLENRQWVRNTPTATTAQSLPTSDPERR